MRLSVGEKMYESVAEIEALCDPRENLDTRTQNLVPAVWDFTFLSYLFYWSHDLMKLILRSSTAKSVLLCTSGTVT